MNGPQGARVCMKWNHHVVSQTPSSLVFRSEPAPRQRRGALGSSAILKARLAQLDVSTGLSTSIPQKSSHGQVHGTYYLGSSGDLYYIHPALGLAVRESTFLSSMRASSFVLLHPNCGKINTAFKAPAPSDKEYLGNLLFTQVHVSLCSAGQVSHARAVVSQQS